jgi:predicted transposase YdaD
MRYISTIEEIAVEDNQIEIAKSLLQEGVSIEIISRSTKLSIERVKELQQQMNNGN